MTEMSSVANFLFADCAKGARITYAIITFFVAMSAMLAGFRQIQLAQTIHDIVKSGDLVSEEMRQRTNKFFYILFGVQIVYISLWATMNILQVSNDHLLPQMTAAGKVINFAFTMSGMALYLYTIMMLRKAIS